MDMSKFLDDSFDAKEWINASFQAQRDSTVGKDQHASTIVMKLQKFIQHTQSYNFSAALTKYVLYPPILGEDTKYYAHDLHKRLSHSKSEMEVNGVIEETSQQALQNLPKVMREIEAVKQEAELLKEQMRVVKRDIQKVEHDTSQSMQILLKLDTIKGRMTAASDALKEADNWTTLSADVEDVFLSQDLQAMTNKLVGMQQSLQMLVDTPDYNDRQQYLESLKNQLEAHLSPQIVSAFISQSVEAAVMYVNIFRSINRLPQLHIYYHNCQKKELLNLWKKTIDNNPDDSVVEWLTEYLDLLLSSWHTQMKWCRQVFTDPLTLVCDLISDTLTYLDPSLTSLIAPVICDVSDPLDVLISLKQVSERFGKSMENVIESHSTGDYTKYIDKLLEATYAPYRFYIGRYTTYEETTLMAELDKILLDHADIDDTVRLLGESTTKLFHVAKMANERCMKFTEGFGYIYLVEAYKTYFSAYAQEFQRVLVNVREKCKPGQFYLEEEDWTNFQHSLRVIQTAGELIMHVEELEDTVVSNVLTSVAKLHIQSPRTHEHRYSSRTTFDTKSALLLSNNESRRSLGILVSKLNDGDSPNLFNEIKKEMYRISESVHKLAFDIAFTHVNNYLSGVSQFEVTYVMVSESVHKLAFDIAFTHVNNYLSGVSHFEIWTSESAGGAVTSDLPMFSLSPQEYITKVGQYLMTLPQQLEPFTMEENPAVAVALKHGKLPYTEDQEVRENMADLWLESIARGMMHVYCEEILRINHLTPHATKQIIVDIVGV